MSNSEDTAASSNKDSDQQAPGLATQDQLDRLLARMDCITDMFTQLMATMAINDMRMPNILGWLPSNHNAPGANSSSNNQANCSIILLTVVQITHKTYR